MRRALPAPGWALAVWRARTVADDRQEDDTEIDGDRGEKGEESLVVKDEVVATFHLYTERFGDPSDQAEEGRARGLRALEEFEPQEGKTGQSAG
jgi:hypothetical protein